MPYSILLDDDWRIKITDFGSAKVVDPVTLEPVEEPEGGQPLYRVVRGSSPNIPDSLSRGKEAVIRGNGRVCFA
jgi:serine/threonine protein kinase